MKVEHGKHDVTLCKQENRIWRIGNGPKTTSSDTS